MVIPEIQQVTKRSKSKQTEWKVKEAVRRAAKEWVEEANQNNANWMVQDMRIDQNTDLQQPIGVTEQEETWKVLADC